MDSEMPDEEMAETSSSSMTQMALENFERRFEPIYLIQAFDHLLQLLSNQKLSYIGVNKTDIYKDIADLPVYLFYSNPEIWLDEIDGLFYLTKFLDSYKNGQKIVYRMNHSRLLSSLRRLLALELNEEPSDQKIIQRLSFMVFSLTDIVSYDFHDYNWQLLLKVFEEIHRNSNFDGNAFYNPPPSTTTLSEPTISGQDFTKVLPNELTIKIFSNLNGGDLLSCTGVNKQWRIYGQNKLLWTNLCKSDGIFANPFSPPNYKPRPEKAENSWLIGFGNKYFKEHAIEMPPRFYNRSSMMYSPAADFFGLRWHNEMFQNESTTLISQWLRSQKIRKNWMESTPINIAEIFVHDEGAITCMDVKAGFLASGSENRSLACFSLENGTMQFYKKKAHGGGIWSIGINDEGSWLASGATDRTIRIWKITDGTLLKIFVGHTNIVRTLKVFGNRIISGSRDKSIRIWSMDTARTIILEHETDGIRHIETGNENMIFSGGYEGTVKVWDIENGELIQTLEGHTERITKIQFDSTQNILATGSLDCSIRIWDILSFKLLACIKTKSKCINFILDKDHIYSAHSDGTIKCWNWKTSQLLYEILNHSKEITSMFLAPFNSIVTHNEKGSVHLWNASTGEWLSTLYQNNDVVNSRIWQMHASSTQLILATNRCESSLLIALDFDFPNP